MKKIYEAVGEDKRGLIELHHNLESFDRKNYESNAIDEMVMITSVKQVPINSIVDETWCLNGLLMDNNDKNDIIIIEPFEEQINNDNLVNISENNTFFNKPIKLSKKAIYLMSVEKYNKLIEDKKVKKELKRKNIRLYEGEKDLALEMLFYDQNYIYIEMNNQGYFMDNKNHIDKIPYIERMLNKQEELVKLLIKLGKNVTYKADINKKEKNQDTEKESIIDEKIEEEKATRIDELDNNCKIITGLTNEVEGSVNIDEDLYATTDIGKTRKNQEDAVLLIKDKENPKFKMIAVADGMGGWSKGEVASDAVIRKLKEWFENLSKQEKESYYTGVENLTESIKNEMRNEIESEVLTKTERMGGSTVVCAIVGQDSTLVANIGDSRAYFIKKGKIKQISREDTVTQENLENGKLISKEMARFDQDSNQITQCLGMNERELRYPNVEIINNQDYDMILLFSDGVTDCLSDEDIAVVCRNSDKKELTDKIVEKAIRHDSIEPEEFCDYTNLHPYIPGGKDNTTAAVYIHKKEDDREER